MKLKRWILFAFVLTAAGLTPARAEEARKVPHYFPEGIETNRDPVQQWTRYLQYLSATDVCRGGVGKRATGYTAFTNSIRVEREVAGKKVTFIFEPWSKSGDKIVFYDFCGQKFISQEEFNLVVEDYVSEVRQAAALGHEYYKDIEQAAVNARAERLGMKPAELQALLDKPVPESPKVTYRELLLLPRKVSKSDYVPNEIHLGYIEYLGVTWLNSGVVYTSLQSRITDYLMGKPLVTLHEFTHANTNLQSFPLSEGVDVELIASIPEMLVPDDKISLVYHGYARDVRELVWVYFGFDFDKVKNEVVLFDHVGNLRIDEKKFNEYVGKLDAVKVELLDFFRNKALPEFYSDPLFWTALHEKLQDTRGVFKVMMSINYDPTLLGGHEATMRWLKANEDKIRRRGFKAYQGSGKTKEGDGNGPDLRTRGISQKALADLLSTFGLTEEQALKLGKKYNITAEDLQNKSVPELINLFRRIQEQERKEGR